MNRKGLPKGLRKSGKRLEKNEHKAWQRGQLGCVVWNDQTVVTFLSTHHRVDSLTPVPAQRGREATTRLTVSEDYNNNMGHVDTVDQLRSYYVVQRRGRRTWPAVAMVATRYVHQQRPISCGVWRHARSRSCCTFARSC